MRGERGFVLVITLVVTALLVALATEFIHEVFVATSHRKSFSEAQQASLLAESGIKGGIKLLQETQKVQDYTSFLDRWARPLAWEDEAGSVTVTIENEEGKFPLNSLVTPAGSLDDWYYGIAMRLFRKVGVSPDLIEGVADWVDVDDEPRAAGAEAKWYASLASPYAPANGPLQTMDELGLVKGYAGKPLAQIRPFVTVYADAPLAPTAKININTASRELLASLDERMSDDLAGRIIDHRKRTPFKSTTELLKVAGMETIGLALQFRVRVKGAVFRIQSLAKVGETTRIIEAVARIDGSQVTVLYWREY
ncbi:MAG: type II secretion system minor pseudopilin GspK [Geobacter sp.]|nr:type II secretion system minor pseudopilin GspK [Geobacter sp.]